MAGNAASPLPPLSSRALLPGRKKSKHETTPLFEPPTGPSLSRKLLSLPLQPLHITTDRHLSNPYTNHHSSTQDNRDISKVMNKLALTMSFTHSQTRTLARPSAHSHTFPLPHSRTRTFKHLRIAHTWSHFAHFCTRSFRMP